MVSLLLRSSPPAEGNHYSGGVVAELHSAPTSVYIYHDSLGHWYASCVVQRKRESLLTTEGPIGIGWGVNVTATASNPDVDLPYIGAHKAAAG